MSTFKSGGELKRKYIKTAKSAGGVDSDVDDDDVGVDADGDENRRVSPPRREVLISVDTLARLEENYSRTHQFLASTLSGMTSKRNVPHLNGLAATLVHSCPSVAVAPGPSSF